MPIPLGLKYEIDDKYWLYDFDPTNSDHHTKEFVNTYITARLACYRSSEQGEYLWELFCEDFGEYTGIKRFSCKTWKLAHRVALRHLQEHVVRQGVWVRATGRGVSHAEALQECLEWEELPKELNLLTRPKIQLAKQPQQLPQIQQSQLPMIQQFQVNQQLQL